MFPKAESEHISLTKTSCCNNPYKMDILVDNNNNSIICHVLNSRNRVTQLMEDVNFRLIFHKLLNLKSLKSLALKFNDTL